MKFQTIPQVVDVVAITPTCADELLSVFGADTFATVEGTESETGEVPFSVEVTKDLGAGSLDETFVSEHGGVFGDVHCA